MIENWEDAAFETDGRVTTFRTEHLEITFTGTGIEGGCPAERDNDGCYVCEDGGVTLAPGGDDHGAQGVLQQLVPLAFRRDGRRRREHRKDPTRHPDGRERRLRWFFIL